MNVMNALKNTYPLCAQDVLPISPPDKHRFAEVRQQFEKLDYYEHSHRPLGYSVLVLQLFAITPLISKSVIVRMIQMGIRHLH